MDDRKIGLAVEVLFCPDGTRIPRKIIYNERAYPILRVMDIRRYCPQAVGCIAPEEYTVRMEDGIRKIYYEADSQTWFAVRGEN